MTPDDWAVYWQFDARSLDMWYGLPPEFKEEVKNLGGFNQNTTKQDRSKILVSRMKKVSGKTWLVTAEDQRKALEATESTSGTGAGSSTTLFRDVHLRAPSFSLQPVGGWVTAGEVSLSQQWALSFAREAPWSIIQVSGDGLWKAGFGYVLNAFWGMIDHYKSDGKLVRFRLLANHTEAGYATSMAHGNVYETFFDQPADVTLNALEIEDFIASTEERPKGMENRKPMQLTRMMVQETDDSWNVPEIERCRGIVAANVRFAAGWKKIVEVEAANVFGRSYHEDSWWAIHIRRSDKTKKEAPGNANLSIPIIHEYISHMIYEQLGITHFFVCSDDTIFKDGLVQSLREITGVVLDFVFIALTSWSFLDVFTEHDIV